MTRISTLVAALLVGACSSTAPVSPVAEKTPDAPPPVSAAPAPVPVPSKTPPTPPKATQAPKAAAAVPASTPKAAPTPVVAAAPTLDLKGLEARLKGSSAIGVMTKLSLKNQVDDLVKRFRAYHDGSRPPQLTDLRPSYELLVMKVLSLLQDKDVALAKDINASREAIWGLLSDREKLSRYA